MDLCLLQFWDAHERKWPIQKIKGQIHMNVSSSDSINFQEFKQLMVDMYLAQKA